MEEMEMNQMEEVQDSQAEEVQISETNEATEPQADSPKEKKVPFWQELVEILETMLISIFVVLILFTYLIRPVTVDGRSMNPTLLDGDKLVMYRLFYEPKPGDIVVVYNHEGHVLDKDNKVVDSGYSLNENIIKRVIAVEGQTVMVDETEGHVYVNGVALQEDYINDRTLTNDGAFVYPITIPKGYIFVMGDNRNKSTDSRSSAVGLVAVEDVLGKTFFRYYPFDELGFID